MRYENGALNGRDRGTSCVAFSTKATASRPLSSIDNYPKGSGQTVDAPPCGGVPGRVKRAHDCSRTLRGFGGIIQCASPLAIPTPKSRREPDEDHTDRKPDRTRTARRAAG